MTALLIAVVVLCLYTANFVRADFAINIDGQASGTAVDKLGNILLAGIFRSKTRLVTHQNQQVAPIEHPTNPLNTHPVTGYIIKLSPSLRQIWRIYLYGTVDISLSTGPIAVDQEGGLLITGSFTQSLNITDPFSNDTAVTLFSAANTSDSNFAMKFDRNGRFQWSSQLSADVVNNFYSAVFDRENNAVIGFSVRTRANYTLQLPNQTSLIIDNQSGTVLLLKLNNTHGALLSMVRIEGVYTLGASFLCVDIESNVIALTQTASSFVAWNTTFWSSNGTSTAATLRGRSSGLVVKFSKSGDLLWYNRIGGRSVSVATDNLGNVYLAGYTSSNYQVETVTTLTNMTVESNLETSTYLTKLNSTGEHVWTAFQVGNVFQLFFMPYIFIAQNSIYYSGAYMNDASAAPIFSFQPQSNLGNSVNITTAATRAFSIVKYSSEGQVSSLASIDGSANEYLYSAHEVNSGFAFTIRSSSTNLQLRFHDTIQNEMQRLGGVSFSSVYWFVEKEILKIDLGNVSNRYCFLLGSKGIISPLTYSLTIYDRANLSLPAFSQNRYQNIEVLCQQKSCYIYVQSILVKTYEDLPEETNFLLESTDSISYSCRSLQEQVGEVLFGSGSLLHANQTIQLSAQYGFRNYLANITNDLLFRVQSFNRDNFIVGFEANTELVQFEVVWPQTLTITTNRQFQSLTLPFQDLTVTFISFTVSADTVTVYQNTELVYSTSLGGNLTKMFLSTGSQSAFLQDVALMPLPPNVTEYLLYPEATLEASTTLLESSSPAIIYQTTLNPSETETSKADEPTVKIFSLFGISGLLLWILIGVAGFVVILIFSVILFCTVKISRRHRYQNNNTKNETTMLSSILVLKTDQGTLVNDTTVF